LSPSSFFCRSRVVALLELFCGARAGVAACRVGVVCAAPRVDDPREVVERVAGREGAGAAVDLDLVLDDADDVEERVRVLDDADDVEERVRVLDGADDAEDPVRVLDDAEDAEDPDLVLDGVDAAELSDRVRDGCLAVGGRDVERGDLDACGGFEVVRCGRVVVDPREAAVDDPAVDRDRDVVRAGGVLRGAAWASRLRLAWVLDVLRPVVVDGVPADDLRVRVSVRIRRGAPVSTWRVAGSRRAEDARPWLLFLAPVVAGTERR